MENTNQPVTPSDASTQSEAISNPVKNQRGFFLIILGVLILLIVIGGGIYLLTAKETQSPMQNDERSINSTQTVSAKPIPNSVNKIAFIKNREIWVVNEDGTESKKLLGFEPIIFNNSSLTTQENKSATDFFNKYFFSDLSWSKDGKELAVTALSKSIENEAKDTELAKKNGVGNQFWFPPHGDIYIIDVESGKYEVIEGKEENTLIGEVQWSYDNGQIVFKRERPGNQQPGEIVLTDIKSRNENVLTNYEYQGNTSRMLTWFPERNEIFYKEKISYHVDSPEPSVIRFNYATNQKNEKPVEVTPGYRLHTYSFLADGRIMYFSTALGPEKGTQYGMYEVRVSNADGSNSKVLYTGNKCGKDDSDQGGCYWMYFSPNGNYAVGGRNSQYVLKPETPAIPILDFNQTLGGFTWNKDGNKIAYLDKGGIAVSEVTNGTKKTILQQPNIQELKWAY